MDDLISRQAAIDAPVKMVSEGLEWIPVYHIKELPPVKLERKKGEWIEHEWAEEAEGCLISNYECSCCHTWERKNSDYCPNCGADMRGKKE